MWHQLYSRRNVITIRQVRDMPLVPFDMHFKQTENRANCPGIYIRRINVKGKYYRKFVITSPLSN